MGKTTLAVNFALRLSRHGSTVLVDLDTGTSSVRSCIPTEPAKDLYHVKKKGASLGDCVTRLEPRFDPEGRYRRFGFIAGPRHFIDEIANPDEAFRRRLIREINRLDAEYVVLDLRAGLDETVLDFLPYANTGILVFTPHHPAATLAASDIVKAILFRSLRILFARDSAFYDQPGMERYHDFINELLDTVEDVYDESIPNLDAFVTELREALGDHPILYAISDTLENFRVHYVLNMFDGVKESFEHAIVPFVENITSHVSSRVHLTQLGWLVDDRRIHEANCSGFPVILDRRQPEPVDVELPLDEVETRVMAELERLESSFLGLERPARRKTDRPTTGRSASPRRETDDLLDGQLQTLKAMYTDHGEDAVRENFSYLVYRALNLMSPSYGTQEFGMARVAATERLLEWYMSRSYERMTEPSAPDEPAATDQSPVTVEPDAEGPGDGVEGPASGEGPGDTEEPVDREEPGAMEGPFSLRREY